MADYSSGSSGSGSGYDYDHYDEEFTFHTDSKYMMIVSEYEVTYTVRECGTRMGLLSGLYEVSSAERFPHEVETVQVCLSHAMDTIIMSPRLLILERTQSCNRCLSHLICMRGTWAGSASNQHISESV